MLRAFALVVAMSASSFASPPPQAAEATRLFDEGRALAKQGDFAAACDRFVRSLDLDPHALGTELNLADCNEHLGHLRKAWEMFSLAADDATRMGDERAAYASARLAAVEAKLATITLHVAKPDEPNLVITVGDVAARVAGTIVERVEPGSVQVAARAPGRAPFAMTVTAIAGATLAIEIPAPVEVAAPAEVEPRLRSRVHLAQALGGLGVASVLTSVTLVAVARHDYTETADSAHCARRGSDGLDCDPTGTAAIHRAQRVADVGTGFAVTSVIALASSAIIYLTAPRARRVAITPVLGLVGVAASGSF